MFGTILLGRRRASGPPLGALLGARWARAGVVVEWDGGEGGWRTPIRAWFCRMDCRFRSIRRFWSRGFRRFHFRPGAHRLWGELTSGGDTSGGSGSTGSSGGSTSGSGNAYNLMMSQDWGSQAADAAAAMGVSAAALAATCEMESQCQNTGAAPGGSATGAFQMINSTYTADINGAIAEVPSIAGSIVSGLAGRMDPGTEAYAAAYELQQDAQLLQGDTGSNPTVLQVRAVYQFGAGSGPSVATAPDSANIESIVNLSAASLAANRADGVFHGRGLASDADENTGSGCLSGRVSRKLKDSCDEMGVSAECEHVLCSVLFLRRGVAAQEYAFSWVSMLYCERADSPLNER